jgi:hypothetical protein
MSGYNELDADHEYYVNYFIWGELILLCLLSD